MDEELVGFAKYRGDCQILEMSRGSRKILLAPYHHKPLRVSDFGTPDGQAGFPSDGQSARLVAAIFAGLVAAGLLGAINWAVDSSAVLMAEKGLSDSWPFLALAWLLFWWILHKFFKVLPMRRMPCFTFAG
mmetsp:Transcript_30964/g.49874  ORF Transcript_30964/g.49874 Transcript_30964/m.49874 type:complete len:131 (-) Transcript_30964:47-439(-)